MQIYLPVAEVSVNFFTLVGIGGGVGFLSGLFGVGGGFLMTPLLLFVGVPPAIAVGTGGNQVVGASFSGMLTHWKRKTVDVPMGLVLLAGGLFGSSIGVWAFGEIRKAGQIDLVISLAYIVLLGTVGGLMLTESISAFRRSSSEPRSRSKPDEPRKSLAERLPLRVSFERSGLRISVLPPLAIGFGIGIIAAMLGIGGGFILVPAMIYLLKMPTNVVIGTSLFQIVFVTAYSTILHAVANHTVDIVLAIMLLLGGVIGAQLGAQAGMRLRGEQLRALLAVIILAVAGKLAADLVLEPAELYSIETLADGEKR